MSGATAGPGDIAAGRAGGGGDDGTAERLIGFLRAEGAAQLGHAGGRALLDHLLGTYEIVRRWGQPPWLQHAALLHSVYGTGVYHPQLVPESRREELVEIAGARAEHLARLFGVTPRDPLFAGTHLWARDPPAPRSDLDALVLLHMANLADQAQARDGSPGRWLVRLRDLAELLIDSEAVTLPLFVAGLAGLSEADESLTRQAYRAGLARAEDQEAMATRLALAAATCQVVAEPCIWQAYVARSRGDHAAARWWAQRGARRLLDLGTTWDKRLSFDAWLELSHRLEQPGDAAPAGVISDPRALADTLRHRHHALVPERGASAPGRPRDTEGGMRRFHRYLEIFEDADGPALRGLYPELESQPWFDPPDFPLAGYLESHYEAIRDEILGLSESRFHRESERIKRSGDWEVAFLYERGRRRDDVCDACPVTTRGVESYPAMRTVAGLIYASRMRAGTHIQPHRGPTNLRVRCHLGITVPEGDCAIRVGDQTRRWAEGRCIVFDDHFEHEAWNHTDEDRVVLIVDLWHPGLTGAEVRALEGLHAYVYAYARQLNRYWSANAAAARNPAGR